MSWTVDSQDDCAVARGILPRMLKIPTVLLFRRGAPDRQDDAAAALLRLQKPAVMTVVRAASRRLVGTAARSGSSACAGECLAQPHNRPASRQSTTPVITPVVSWTSLAMSSGALCDAAAVEDRNCRASARCSTRSPGNSGNRTDLRGQTGARRRREPRVVGIVALPAL